MSVDLSLLPIGATLVTRDCRKARLLANDLAVATKPFAAVVEPPRFCCAVTQVAGFESVIVCTADGRIVQGNLDSSDIVATAPKTLKYRIVISPHADSGERWAGSVFFEGGIGFGSKFTEAIVDRFDEVAL